MKTLIFDAIWFGYLGLCILILGLYLLNAKYQFIKTTDDE